MRYVIPNAVAGGILLGAAMELSAEGSRRSIPAERLRRQWRWAPAMSRVYLPLSRAVVPDVFRFAGSAALALPPSGAEVWVHSGGTILHIL